MRNVLMDTFNRFVPILSVTHFSRSIVICFILMFLCLNKAGAQTLAVFPLLDLTQDKNGINFVLTERVRREVSQVHRVKQLQPPPDIAFPFAPCRERVGRIDAADLHNGQFFTQSAQPLCKKANARRPIEQEAAVDQRHRHD